MELKFVAFFLLTLSDFYIFVVSQYSSNGVDLKNKILELSVLTPWDMVERYNFSVENHNITTSDGYILSVQRVDGKNSKTSISKPPVLIVLGLLTSTALYLNDEETLVYRLADLGYDVWLLNTRGTTYSRGHKYLDPDSSKYWNFSFHEMGIYDAPNTIDYILENTKQKSLSCITHSQGAPILNILLSKLPEYNDKIRLLIHLAPAIYLTHTLRLLNMLAKSNFYVNLEEFVDKYGYFGTFQNQGLFQSLMANEICGRPTFSKMCSAAAQYQVGPNFENTNLTKIPIYLSHFPSGASVKQFFHFAQIIIAGDFVEYTNHKTFFAPSYKPRVYNLTAVSAPTAIFYGKNDWIVAYQDVQRYTHQVPNLIMRHIVEDQYFNHIDFILGNNRFEMIDQHIIALLNKF